MEKPYNIYDYEVLDRNGRRLGPIRGYWVDEATGQPEFASVRTGWLMGKEHVIPIRDAHFDYAGRRLRVPYEERLIRDAPGFAADHDFSPDEEARIYRHYGLSRSLGRSPTGLPGRGGAAGRDALGGGTREPAAEIPLHEERVDVGKRTVEEGHVRLRKVVRTETVDVPVELTRERIDIERIPPGELRGTLTQRPFEEDEVVLRERREEPVVEKTRELTGGVRATRDVETERRDVRAAVRREDVEVDRDADADRRGPL
ncbi:MAG TPA: PRC and DUF2382 domain-containing protein [Candidatus Thermoplasmatota archaeon]|nr:PRC and DUF2382 domain-containing protein [Candidatus Thermoplasmatota archaeon]